MRTFKRKFSSLLIATLIKVRLLNYKWMNLGKNLFNMRQGKVEWAVMEGTLGTLREV